MSKPKIGVYICQCGSNIAATVNTEAVAATHKDKLVDFAAEWMVENRGRSALFQCDPERDQAGNEGYRLPVDCPVSLIDGNDPKENRPGCSREEGKGERNARDSESKGCSKDHDRQVSLTMPYPVFFGMRQQDNILVPGKVPKGVPGSKGDDDITCCKGLAGDAGPGFRLPVLVDDRFDRERLAEHDLPWCLSDDRRLRPYNQFGKPVLFATQDLL